jgi:phage terminase large subunit
LWGADKGAKLRIIPKDKVRDVIGRSPDYADCAMMRMYFDLDIKKATFGVQRH